MSFLSRQRNVTKFLLFLFSSHNVLRKHGLNLCSCYFFLSTGTLPSNKLKRRGYKCIIKGKVITISLLYIISLTCSNEIIGVRTAFLTLFIIFLNKFWGICIYTTYIDYLNSVCLVVVTFNYRWLWIFCFVQAEQILKRWCS